ncbi:hypothetical protein [Cerasicoccus maritimus]|uniref:hypothetical protein n=1 Tax=Cerasicoccus maritimus TaxID=490089 RepID=UPI00285293A4|nr:hypothetical protein [Cerasicoccus maritimus]
MNILFLEDEVELSAIGVEQLRNLGHSVYPALDLAEARQIVEENWQSIHLIMADHRLPDGRGIDFLMEVKQLYPRIKLAVVSGCLTPVDEETLRSAQIPYFTKPLLYRQVIKKLREHYMISTKPPFKKSNTPPLVPPSPPPAGKRRPPPSLTTKPEPPQKPFRSPQETRPVYQEPEPPPPTPPPKGNTASGLLAAAGLDGTPTPPKRKGLTSVIFKKLTRKDD